MNAECVCRNFSFPQCMHLFCVRHGPESQLWDCSVRIGSSKALDVAWHVITEIIIKVLQSSSLIDFCPSWHRRNPTSVMPHSSYLSQYPSPSRWKCLSHCCSWSRWRRTFWGCSRSPGGSAAGAPGPCPPGSWCRPRPGSPAGSGCEGSAPSRGCGSTWRTGPA